MIKIWSIARGIGIIAITIIIAIAVDQNFVFQDAGAQKLRPRRKVEDVE